MIKIIDDFGRKRVYGWRTYQSIDVIEYYKSYSGHKEPARGRQAPEGAKVIFFKFLTIFKGIFVLHF
jgi:hypothetical protein